LRSEHEIGPVLRRFLKKNPHPFIPSLVNGRGDEGVRDIRCKCKNPVFLLSILKKIVDLPAKSESIFFRIIKIRGPM
jgi:hypothetical protein